MIFISFYKIIKRIKFERFKKNQNLIFDDGGLNLNIQNATIINPRFLYIIYFPLNFKGFKKKYFEKIVKSINPKKIIIHDIIAPNILQNLNKIKNFETIVIQHSFRWEWERVFMIPFKCTYFLTFNEYEKSFFEPIVDGKILITGPVKANIKIRNNNHKKYDMLFVSEFRKKNDWHHRFQFQIFGLLEKYCFQKNLRLGIAYNSNRADKMLKLHDEISFLESEMIDTDDACSYQKASVSNTILVMHSNLGLELLSHKYKVIFFSLLKLPFFDTDDGPFWTIKNHELYFSDKLTWLFNLEQGAWEEYLMDNHCNLVTGDKKNSVLNKLLI